VTNTSKKSEKSIKYSVESYLPTLTKLLIDWPELSPLLSSFKNRDYGTFMHSLAVHFTGQMLTYDLSVRIKNFPSVQINNRSPFFMLHDIGKTVADKDMEVALKTVFPSYPDNRTNYQKAKHWIHPQMSDDLIKLWSASHIKNIQPQTLKWAELSYLHDIMLNPFLNKTKGVRLNYADKLSLYIFSISDTAMAMGLPRPHDVRVFSQSEIRIALISKYLSDTKLVEFFSNQEISQIRNYILASVFDSLKQLNIRFKTDDWIKPENNPDYSKTKLLDDLAIQSWKECEQFWDSTMIKMDLAKIF